VTAVRVAVVQPSGLPFQRDEAVESVVEWTRRAASEGAQLVLFPEAFVGGYPWGLNFGVRIGARTDAGRRLWGRYHAAAIEIPGPETARMAEVARETGLHLAVGVIERDREGSRGTLYCTLLYIGPDGSILGKHRKVRPTAAERVIWGEGDGSTLPVFETGVGRIGGLICWENYMPLARTALYGLGVQLYLAPTADARDRWQSTLAHIALEGRCFVLGCNQFVRQDMYPADLEVGEELVGLPDVLCRGGSAIYAPDGRCVAGPLLDGEGMLLADLDLEETTLGLFDFDAVGHYARPDLFRLIVQGRPQRSVEWMGPDPDA